MPIELTVLSARPPSPDDLLRAARSVLPGSVVQVLPGAAAQVVDGSGAVLLTLVAPRLVEVAGEQSRLLGVEDAERPWWSEAVAASQGSPATAVVEALAASCDGVVART